MKTKIENLVVFALFLLCFQVAAQKTPSKSDTLDLMNMSFEDLMEVRIVSASKKDERLFDSPVTSYVISREDIVSSGATAIPDALRLAPGLIVREMANGSYDVSIRGGRDGLVSHQFWYLNTSILAMINDRVIFNYYSGGTYWQNLPVDIEDVERIEIVYGPNAPLYGPNALDGVINIITRRAGDDPDTYGSATLQAGRDLLFSVLGGKVISEDLEVNVSVNHSNRKRSHVEYYDRDKRAFIPDLREHSDTTLAQDPNLVFPDGETGSMRTGINFNLYFRPSDKVHLSFNSGYNHSNALVGSTIITNLQHISNNSLSQTVKGEFGNFTLQSSIIRGHMGTSGNVSELVYDYSTSDTYLDYYFNIGPKISLRPSLSFQYASIDDKPYTVDVGRDGLFNNKASMTNQAFAIKSDYAPSDAWRLIGALRVDKFKKPDDHYLSYQGIVTFEPYEDGLIRLLAGRSFSGSFIEQTYLDWTAFNNPFLVLKIMGTTDRDLLRNDILELGYRMRVGNSMSVDLSVFRQSYSGFTAFVTKVTATEPSSSEEWSVVAENVELKAVQTGATLSMTWLFGNVKFTPSITVQETALTDYSPYYVTHHPIFAPVNNTRNVSNVKSDYAPNVFGGFMLNVPLRQWSVNLSGYYYSRYALTGLNSLNSEGVLDEENGLDRINGKFLLNAKAAYRFNPALAAFINARNLLGSDAREGYGTDRIGATIFAGVNIEF